MLIERYADEFGIKILSFRAENKPFDADTFVEDLLVQNQTITFSSNDEFGIKILSIRAAKNPSMLTNLLRIS